MEPLLKAYNAVIQNKTYSQATPPTNQAIEFLKKELIKEAYIQHSGLNNLVQVALDLGLTPYFKRDGVNVENTNYKPGDLIGLYFARRVSFNKNRSLVVKGKFFGIDLTKPTINMQLFATDKQPDPNVITLANKYGKRSDVIRGSLRVSVTDALANQIIDDFINLVK